MLDRTKSGKKCAMIGVSSSSWLRRMPQFLVYTATKSFATYLSVAIDYEFKTSPNRGDGSKIELIDFHCFVPSGTATNIVDKRF